MQLLKIPNMCLVIQMIFNVFFSIAHAIILATLLLHWVVSACNALMAASHLVQTSALDVC